MDSSGSESVHDAPALGSGHGDLRTGLRTDRRRAAAVAAAVAALLPDLQAPPAVPPAAAVPRVRPAAAARQHASAAADGAPPAQHVPQQDGKRRGHGGRRLPAPGGRHDGAGKQLICMQLYLRMYEYAYVSETALLYTG